MSCLSSYPSSQINRAINNQINEITDIAPTGNNYKCPITKHKMRNLYMHDPVLSKCEKACIFDRLAIDIVDKDGMCPGCGLSYTEVLNIPGLRSAIQTHLTLHPDEDDRETYDLLKTEIALKKAEISLKKAEDENDRITCDLKKAEIAEISLTKAVSALIKAQNENDQVTIKFKRAEIAFIKAEFILKKPEDKNDQVIYDLKRTKMALIKAEITLINANNENDRTTYDLKLAEIALIKSKLQEHK